MTADQLLLAQLSAAQLIGEAHAFRIVVNSEGVNLPHQNCRLVKLENWDTAPDFTSAVNDPIYWGYNGVYVHRLGTGGNSELLPVNNLAQIWARTPKAGGGFAGSATLFVSYYR